MEWISNRRRFEIRTNSRNCPRKLRATDTRTRSCWKNSKLVLKTRKRWGTSSFFRSVNDQHSSLYSRNVVFSWLKEHLRSHSMISDGQNSLAIHSADVLHHCLRQKRHWKNGDTLSLKDRDILSIWDRTRYFPPSFKWEAEKNAFVS